MTAAPGECTAYGHHKLSAVWASLSEDIVRYLNKSPENQAAGDNFKTRVSALLTPQLLCLVLYRVSHYLHVTGWRRSGVAVARFNFLVHKVSITPQSCIGPGVLSGPSCRCCVQWHCWQGAYALLARNLLPSCDVSGQLCGAWTAIGRPSRGGRPRGGHGTHHGGR